MLLITVLIIGSVSLFVSLGVAIRGITELDMGLAEHQSMEALAIADGCIQESLLRLSRDSGYTGGTYTIADGSCTISVSGAGSERIIDVSATVNRWTRRLQANVSLAGGVELLYWEQVR